MVSLHGERLQCVRSLRYGQWAAFWLLVASWLSHRVVSADELPNEINSIEEGVPCGDHWDGTWVKVPPSSVSGPSSYRVGECVVGKDYLTAKVGPLAGYQILEVLYSDPSSFLDDPDARFSGGEFSVYAGADWSQWEQLAADGKVSRSDMLDLSQLFGRQSSYLTDAVRRVRRFQAAEGNHVTFVPEKKGSGSITVCDLWICAVPHNFDRHTGEAISSQGAYLLQIDRVIKPSQRSSIAAGGTCSGYPGKACPDGTGCTGVYTSIDCRSVCHQGSACKEGDVELGDKPDCGIGWFGAQCGAKLCGACGCVGGAFLKSELLSMDYPSSPSDITSTENSVDVSSEVSNRGATKQQYTVQFDFSSSVQTSMKLTNSSETSSKVSLKIPVPKIGVNLGVEKGDIQELTNGETTKSGSKMSVKYSYGVNVDPYTNLKATGSIFTKTVTIKIPVTYKIYDSCGGSYEVRDTAIMTSSGVISETSSMIKVRYEGQPTDNAPPGQQPESWSDTLTS